MLYDNLKPTLEIELPRTIEEFKEFYRNYGAKSTILAYMLAKGKPLHLYDIFRFHQQIAGVTSDNSTRKALQRLINDGLVKKLGRGVYVAVPEAKHLMLNTIDLSRVRTKFSIGSGRGKQTKPPKWKAKNLDKQIKRVIRIAKSLAEKGDQLRAVSLLAHTLLGIRQTGVLLYREGGLFIYYEHKDKSIRMIYSKELGELFDNLNLPEGALYEHAYYRAGKIIHNAFGGYKKARRMHYYLKEELKWITNINANGKYYYFAKARIMKIVIEFEGQTYEIILQINLDELDNFLQDLNNPEAYKIQPQTPIPLLLQSQPRKEENRTYQDRYGIIRTTEHTKAENELYYLNF